MHGPVRLTLPRTPSGTPTYSGPAPVAGGWYVVILSAGTQGPDWMAHLRQWAGHEMPSSLGFALIQGAGDARKLGVIFFPSTPDGAVTVRLYGAADPPDALRMQLLPIPRALAAPSVALQNLPALRTAFAAGPGSRLARLRAAMAMAAFSGQAVPPRFAGPLRSDLASVAYRSWITRFDTIGPADEAAIRSGLSGLPPLLVRCGAEASTPGLMRDLQDQLHTGWRAVLDCVPVPAADPRIAFGPGAALQKGECLVVIDRAIRLRPHTLSTLAAAVGPGTSLVYADADRIGKHGERTDPFFKPGFSPGLLHHLDYLGGCVLLAGPELDDMVPAGTEALRRHAAGLPRDTVVHVPLVLSHELGPPVPRPHRDTPAASGILPTVSIIVPTRDRLDLLRACLDSIAARTEYDSGRLEVIVVDNASIEPATLSYLRGAEAAGRLRVLHDPGPFNYPSLNNQAAAASAAEVVVFLNNDTEIADSSWLRRLVAQAMQPDAGAVGCKLLYPDGTVQHAGVVVGMVGVASHIGVGLAADDPGYHGLANATREVSAVTAACLAIRRSVFLQAGGFDPALAVAFNDVALCVAVQALGYRNICLAEPLLIHHESKSRGHDDTPEKAARFFGESALAWQTIRRTLTADPYYSPNLGFDRLYRLAYPPRRRKPWLADAPRRALLLGSGAAAEQAITRQSSALAAAGYAVWTGAPSTRPGQRGMDGTRVVLDEAQDAAAFAVEHDINLVVAHTPPFLSVLRWLGDTPMVILCDHGEPDAGWFRDAERRRRGLAERLICLAMADHVVPPTADIPAYVSSLASQ